jgi:hypothetical protein
VAVGVGACADWGERGETVRMSVRDGEGVGVEVVLSAMKGAVWGEGGEG